MEPLGVRRKFACMKTNLFITTVKIVPAVGACLVVLGCSDASSDRADTTSKAEIRISTNGISATGRDANSGTSLYVRETNDSAARAADNTARNERDRSGATLTPGDQGTSQSDREITQRVRKALMDRNELSITAKNIKIITVNGKVTLRGPVKNDQEQQTIASLAQQVAGVSAVDNQLEVKTINQ